MRKNFLMSIVLLGLCIGSSAHAQEFVASLPAFAHGEPGDLPPPPFGPPMPALDLSREQRDKIDDLFDEQHEQVHDEMRALRKLRRAFDDAQPGSAEYKTATTRLAEAEAAGARARVLRQAELRSTLDAVLTPEQKAELAERKDDRRAPHFERRLPPLPH